MKCSSSLLITAYKVWRSPKGVPLFPGARSKPLERKGRKRTGTRAPPPTPLLPQGDRYPHPRDPSDTPEDTQRAAETPLTAHPLGNSRSSASAPGEARGSERSTAHPRRWKPSIRAGRRPDQPESQCLFASVTGLRGGTRTPSQRKRAPGKQGRRAAPAPALVPEDGGSAWNLPGRTSTPRRTIRPSAGDPHPSPVGTTPPLLPSGPQSCRSRQPRCRWAVSRLGVCVCG